MKILSHCQFVTWTIASLILLMPSQSQGQCPTLYLLNIVPYPVSDGSVASVILWDRAFELIPAGQLAAEQINNCSDILPGQKLELINIDSDACGINIVSKGTTNIYRELVNPNQTCIVGVIGLFCSPVTSAISPIISHPNIGGYVHIAASTSPLRRVSPLNSRDSSLFHIIESSSVFNEATLALMHTYNWQRITSVYTESDIYFKSTSDDFINRVLSTNPEYKLVTRIPISDNSLADITKTFNIINNNGARISYWSVTYEVPNLLCKAFQRNFVWPGYVYIIQEHGIGKILQIETSCCREEMLKAMEGVFILDYRLYVENDTELVSGLSYSEYQSLYTQKLKEFANATNEDIQSNVYANSLYDQVWAFALATNNSLPSVESQNLSFEDYGIGKRVPILSNILKNELKNVTFQGASGRIDFSQNQGSPTFVNIFQVQNGNPKLIGVYDPFSHNVTLTEAALHVSDIPRDTFETIYELLPPWLGGCIAVAQITLFGLITINLILIIWWKRERDIKATSPLFSTLMMIGCYSLCAAPLFQTVYRMFVIDNMVLVTSLCHLKIWASVGIELILSTLFLRLLRIYRIFHAKQMTMMNDYWMDKYLLIYVLSICMGKVFLLILWNSITPISSKTVLEYVPSGLGGTGFPHYMATTHCIISPVWLAITLLYSGILLLMVVVLAIETRHVENDLHKDTKKVNVFIFLVVIVLAITVPLWIIFEKINIKIGAVFEWLAFFSVPLLCQICLLAPKTLPLAIKFTLKKYRRSTLQLQTGCK